MWVDQKDSHLPAWQTWQEFDQYPLSNQNAGGRSLLRLHLLTHFLVQRWTIHQPDREMTALGLVSTIRFCAEWNICSVFQDLPEEAWDLDVGLDVSPSTLLLEVLTREHLPRRTFLLCRQLTWFYYARLWTLPMMFQRLSYEPLLLTDPGIFGVDVFLQFAAKGQEGVWLLPF